MRACRMMRVVARHCLSVACSTEHGCSRCAIGVLERCGGIFPA